MTTNSELRALVQAATPGPWRFVDPSVEDCEIASGTERVMAGSYYEGGSINKPVKQADIALIVAAVSALPGLLDRIAELEAALAGQEGMVMVPRVPTEAMRNAAVDATGAGSDMDWNGRSPQALFTAAYTAMLAAAPQPLAGGG